jgi:hypothetical protein
LAFEPRGQNHAVAEDILSLNDNLTEIDPDPKLDRLSRGGPDQARACERALNGHGALDSVYNAAELGEDSIAHDLHDATSMGGDLRLENLSENLPNGSKSSSLISGQQAAVTSDVAGKNSAKAARNVLVSHSHPDSTDFYHGIQTMTCGNRLPSGT